MVGSTPKPSTKGAEMTTNDVHLTQLNRPRSFPPLQLESLPLQCIDRSTTDPAGTTPTKPGSWPNVWGPIGAHDETRAVSTSTSEGI
jgi:hypothetical protein